MSNGTHGCRCVDNMRMVPEPSPVQQSFLPGVSGSQQFIHVGNHPLESVEKQVFARFDNTHVAKSDKFVIPGYGQLSFC
eukprot:4509335-Amphidinium_carterae.1